MEVIQQRLDQQQEVEGEYLTYLLSNTKMSTKDVYGSITELLLAGVDTVNIISNKYVDVCAVFQTWKMKELYNVSVRRT